ncbi:MAG TPA: hypothetical protein VNO30_42430 [Kofleriaceae bacterium]|nr:hypothetical protein [Kofleriaceae bacterium]
MTDAATVLDRLWTEGVSTDDLSDIAAARSGEIDLRIDSELAVFVAWLAADEANTAGVDNAITDRLTGDPAAELMILAVELRAAMHRRDHATVGLTLAALGDRVPDEPSDESQDELSREPQGPAPDEKPATTDEPHGHAPGDKRTVSGRAAARIALAEAALYSGDLETASRFLRPVSASGPTAFRIAALVRHVTVALAQPKLEIAMTRARQALTLAQQANRKLQAEQAQLLLGLVACLAGDNETMRAMLQPLLEENGPVVPLLAAGLAGPDEALARLGGGVNIAPERGDAAGYALCALVGARHHVAHGRRPDALLTLSAVRVRLGGHAPQVAAVLDAELLAWRHAWGASAFAEAERAAIARLGPESDPALR